VNNVFLLEEDRTGGMNNDAPIVLMLSESAALDNHHHRSRVKVPSSFTARLKYKFGLQYVGWALPFEAEGPAAFTTLRQRNDLQRGHLAVSVAPAENAESGRR
jgi:hypothetical protein